MTKKALLFNYQRNCRDINAWEDLRLWQSKEDLKVYLNREVDILPWSEMANLTDVVNNYDTLILYEFPYMPYRNSKHKKFLLDVLRKFVGKKQCAFKVDGASEAYSQEEKDILKDYYANDFSQDFHNWRCALPNISLGSIESLLMWEPGTYVKPVKGFDFTCHRHYDKATVFIGKYYYESESEMRMMCMNLAKRLALVPAKHRQFVLPIEYGLYEEKFIEILTGYLSSLTIDIIEPIDFKTKKFWKYPLWSTKTNDYKDPGNYQAYSP